MMQPNQNPEDPDRTPKRNPKPERLTLPPGIIIAIESLITYLHQEAQFEVGMSFQVNIPLVESNREHQDFGSRILLARALGDHLFEMHPISTDDFTLLFTALEAQINTEPSLCVTQICLTLEIAELAPNQYFDSQTTPEDPPTISNEQHEENLNFLSKAPDIDTFLMLIQIARATTRMSLREALEHFHERPRLLHSVADFYRACSRYDSMEKSLDNFREIKDDIALLEREVALARGVLRLDPEERESDRYGFVSIHQDNGERGEAFPVDKSLNGKSGRLIAHVLETRDTKRVGDHFLKIAKSSPRVGERIVLGEGRLIVHEGLVGVHPFDGRDNFFMDPDAMFQANAQLVELAFQEFVRSASQ